MNRFIVDLEQTGVDQHTQAKSGAVQHTQAKGDANRTKSKAKHRQNSAVGTKRLQKTPPNEPIKAR